MTIPRYSEWQIAAFSPQMENFAQNLRIPTIVAQILLSRDIRSEHQAKEFLSPSLTAWDSYFLPGTEEFVCAIQRAKAQQVPILIYGDYDVDGITGTCIFLRYLRSIGVKVWYFNPQREREGYGIHPDVLSQSLEKGVKILLTVDCGTEEEQVIQQFQNSGIEVIVTDHHPSRKPAVSANLLINPHIGEYPFAHLSGSGVAYKLVRRCHQVLGGDVEGLLLLAMLGTIADQMPLIGENRALTYQGLEEWNRTELPPFRCLKSSLFPGNFELTEEGVAKKIAPLINAAGRREVPHLAVEFFLSQDEASAGKYLKILEEKNYERRLLSREVTEQAEPFIVQNLNLPILYAFHPHWPVSVIGQVASQFLGKWGKTIMLLTQQNDQLVASVRGVYGFPWKSAFEDHFGGMFLEIGGHEEAFGFRIWQKDWEEFQQRLSSFPAEEQSDSSVLRIDAEIFDPSDQVFQQTRLLAPFGPKNPPPVFLSRKLRVVNLERVGDNRAHLRLILEKNHKNFLSFFSWAGDMWNQLLGRWLTIAFHFSRDPYSGKTVLDIIDVQPE